MAIDKEAIKEHIRGILVALGDDPDREGLKETPDRVARMYEEVFEGMNYTNDEIADMFNKSFERPGKDTSDMVLVKDIEVFSYCEHHMALMYDMHVSCIYPEGESAWFKQDRTDCRYGRKTLTTAGKNRDGYRIYYE